MSEGLIGLINNPVNQTGADQDQAGSKVPVSQQDYLDNIKDTEDERRKKFTLEDGRVVIRHSKMLSSAWVEGSCYFPDTTGDQVRRYLNSKHDGKVFKGGKSLFESGHLSNV